MLSWPRFKLLIALAALAASFMAGYGLGVDNCPEYQAREAVKEELRRQQALEAIISLQNVLEAQRRVLQTNAPLKHD